MLTKRIAASGNEIGHFCSSTINFFCLYSSISQFPHMPTYTEGSHKSQDALSEVMILVKEEAKTHDLNVLINVSECTAIAKKGVLVSFQYLVVKVCSRLWDKIAALWSLNFLATQFHSPNSDSYISKLTSVACVAIKPVIVSTRDKLARKSLLRRLTCVALVFFEYLFSTFGWCPKYAV